MHDLTYFTQQLQAYNIFISLSICYSKYHYRKNNTAYPDLDGSMCKSIMIFPPDMTTVTSTPEEPLKKSKLKIQFPYASQ